MKNITLIAVIVLSKKNDTVQIKLRFYIDKIMPKINLGIKNIFSKQPKKFSYY